MGASPREGVWMAAVASLFLLGGCGGPKSDAGTPADTTTPAAAPAPAPAPADTTPADTARKDTATSMKTDSAAPKPSAAKPEPPAKTAARPSAPAKTNTATATAAKTDTAAPTQTASANAPLRDAYHQAPRDTVTQDVYNGWKQFNLNCARCHGEDVTGTTIAPHLIVSLKPDGPINSKELFISTVCSGRPAKGMPAWCSLGLEMDKIQEIYSYVKGRSDGKIAPGRPAVKSQG